MRFTDDAIDTRDLEPGSTLPQVECEKLIGFTHESDPIGYQLGLLCLQNHIAKMLRRVGRVLTVVCRKGSIEILTHRQAAVYNADRFNQGIKAMRSSNKRLIAVDASELSQDERAKHDENIVRQSRLLAGIRLNQREPISVAPHVSTRRAMFTRK